MPLDPEFIADSPYGPEGMLLDEILQVDREQSLLRARMHTHDDLPLTRTQRVHEVRHPRHINGGLMVHLTGMLGLAHAYYILDLRFAQGWIGFGARIYDARFSAIATVGKPLDLEIHAKRVTRSRNRAIGRYNFTFTQGTTVVYRSEQSAIWLKNDSDSTPLRMQFSE